MRFRELNISRFREERNCEVAGVFPEHSATHDEDINRFFEILLAVLEQNNLSLNIILTGDFNVHFERYDGAAELCNLEAH